MMWDLMDRGVSARMQEQQVDFEGKETSDVQINLSFGST